MTSNISLIRAPLGQREVLCLRVSCSKAHNHALYVVKVSGVSPSSRGLLHGESGRGESGRGEKGTGETVAQVIEQSKRTTRYKQWRWAHSTGGAPRAS